MAQKKERAIITRLIEGDQGTFGELVTSTGFHCKVGELPWRDNLNNFSRIPPGTYEVAMAYSRHFHRMLYKLKNVPDRGEVLIHNGNYVGDSKLGYKTASKGCIILGRYFGVLKGQQAVLNSLPTLMAFIEAMERKPFILEVRDGYQ